MNVPPGLSISPKDWDRTPPSVQMIVIALWQENQVLKQQMVALQEQAAILQGEVERLREQVNRNSRNSSKLQTIDNGGALLAGQLVVQHGLVVVEVQLVLVGRDEVGDDFRRAAHQLIPSQS